MVADLILGTQTMVKDQCKRYDLDVISCHTRKINQLAGTVSGTKNSINRVAKALMDALFTIASFTLSVVVQPT